MHPDHNEHAERPETEQHAVQPAAQPPSLTLRPSAIPLIKRLLPILDTMEEQLAYGDIRIEVKRGKALWLHVAQSFKLFGAE